MEGVGGRQRWGGNYFMGIGPSFGMMNVYWNKIEVVIRQHHECTTCPCIVPLKVVDYMLYDFSEKEDKRGIGEGGRKGEGKKVAGKETEEGKGGGGGGGRGKNQSFRPYNHHIFIGASERGPATLPPAGGVMRLKEPLMLRVTAGTRLSWLKSHRYVQSRPIKSRNIILRNQGPFLMAKALQNQIRGAASTTLRDRTAYHRGQLALGLPGKHLRNEYESIERKH